MFFAGALTLGVACGWLTGVLFRPRERFFAPSVFLAAIVAGVFLTEPDSFIPLVVGTSAGLATHTAFWTRLREQTKAANAG